jgi:uncharacterized Fe-S cluster-containing radical SAM superfamily protein
VNIDPRFKLDGQLPRLKFSDPDWTALGEPRAKVAMKKLDTLWFNTGTLCNITCAHCYIDSSPTNDRLVYLSAAEVASFLDEIAALGLGTREIGFTGGEPFMNPEFLAMVEDALKRDYDALVLTNAMQPMMRPRVKASLKRLIDRYGAKLQIRVSIDHYGASMHDAERGEGSFARTAEGVDWLVAAGARVAIAGRGLSQESPEALRAGYARLFADRGWPIDADHPISLVILPEMDDMAEVPEITTACWGILKTSPDQMMCASSRMIVKRKGAATPVVLPCTLIPYQPAFEMAQTLAQSLAADGGMFDKGAVKLCHVHCAKFCVLGGGSCSVSASRDE